MILSFSLALIGVLGLGSLAGASVAKADYVQTGSWGSPWNVLPFKPTGVDISDSGQVVIADAGGARIGRANTDGTLDKVWGAGPGGPSFTNGTNPIGVAVDPDGNVFSLDGSNGTVTKFSPEGNSLDSWEVTSPGDASYGIEYDSSGSLFILRDTTVQRYSVDGELQDSWGGFLSDLSDPGFTTDDDGHVWVIGAELTTSSADAVIYRFTDQGELLSKWATAARVSYVYTGAKCGPQWGPADHVYGYRGIAAREGGGVWVVPDGAWDNPNYGPPLIEGLDADGVVDKQLGASSHKPRGDLEVGPDGHFWIASDGFHEQGTNEDWSTVSEYDSDGTFIRNFDRSFFPKYLDGDRGEGKFGTIDDIGVSPDGKVDVNEGYNGRIQRFSSAGTFEWLAESPFTRIVALNQYGVHEIFYGTDGGVRLLDSGWRRLYEYSATGMQSSAVDLNFPGNGVSYGATGAGNDNMWIAQGNPVTMSLVDSSGSVLSSFPMPEVERPGLFNATSLKIQRTPDGHLLVEQGGVVREYTTAGTYVTGWTITDAGSGDPAGVVDFAVGTDGTMYALINGYDGTSLQTYSSGGELLGAQAIGAKYATYRQMAVGPTGVLYLVSGAMVYRYEQAASGSASTSASNSTSVSRAAAECDYCEGCYDDPDDPQPVRFKLGWLHYENRHQSARIEIFTPARGRVTIIGDNKLQRRSVKVRQASAFSLKVVLKSRYGRPVTNRSRVDVPVRVRLRFTPSDQGSAEQFASRKLVLKRKLFK